MAPVRGCQAGTALLYRQARRWQTNPAMVRLLFEPEIVRSLPEAHARLDLAAPREAVDETTQT